MKMLNNNGAIQVVRPVPPLIKILSWKGDRTMTENTVPYPAKNGNTPEYRAWASMKRRCNNPNVNNFHNYGGRGISVCERWSIFENFYDDMGKKPSSNHTLDRNDNDKDYSLENCKWATRKEQADNRRNNVNIELNGETHNQIDWSRRLGLADATVKMRIRRGMTPIEAIGGIR